MKKRKELIDELTKIIRNREPEYFIEDVADFILTDQERIVSPLIRWRENKNQIGIEAVIAIISTLDMAGFGEE